MESDGDSTTDENTSSSDDSTSEEEEEKNKKTKVEWKKEGKEFEIPSFDTIPKLSYEAERCVSPLDFLLLYLHSDLMDNIVKATNKYGSGKFGENWAPTDRKEILRFISVIMFMGIYRYPSLQSYWGQDTKTPFISNVFPKRERFLRLHRSFYINHSDRNLSDPLWHVRPLIQSFSISFPHHWDPSRILVVDESLIPCKARSKMKQYLKDKHKRWGYKAWCLVSEKYLFRFEIYTGKQHSKSIESTSSVVENLVTPYYGLNHLVVMNNHFSSIPLFNKLLSHSTFGLGTFQPNRKGFPSEMVSEIKNFNRGDHSFRQNGHLVTYSFMDRQPVYFLSSFHSPNQHDSISRVDKGGTRLTFTVPSAVKDYNLYRGGVDVLDQLHSYYSILRKSRRWWPRLAWWLIDAAISNAHRLYQVRVDPKCSQL
jgi:hypothetical protein